MDTHWMVKAAIKCLGCLLSCWLLASPGLHAQQNPLNRRVTLNLQQQRLDDALFAIGAEAGFDFSYNARILETDRLVDIYAMEMPVRKVISNLIGAGYVVRPMGNHIIIFQRKPDPVMEQAPATYTVQGYLIDAHTGEKVHFATVYAGLNAVTSTDADGHYSLTVQNSSRDLPISFSKRGFHDTVVVVRPDRSPSLTVGLRPKPNFDVPIASREVSLIGDRLQEPFPVVDWFVSEEQQALALNLEVPIQTLPFQISLLPAIGTNRLLSGAAENNFSLNILAGYSNGLRGLEVGGLANIDRAHVTGLQVAGLVNVVGADLRGVQVGGLVNVVGGDVTGLQVAGIANFNKGKVRGLQVAGIANFSPVPVEGMQVSGIVSFAKGDVQAVQIGGILNYAHGNVGGFQAAGIHSHAKGNVGGFQVGGISAFAGGHVGGFQAAGIANMALGDVGGFQVAGIANKAKGDVRGFQVAGILNQARQVKGLQLGLVNIADSLAGYQLGLFNVSKKGYNVVEVSANETFQSQLSLKSGRRGFYNFLSGAYRLGPRTQALAYGLGIGTGFRTGPMSLGLDVACYHVAESYFGFGQLNLLMPARLNVGVNFGRVELFGGAGINLHVTGAQNSQGEFRSQIAARTFWHNEHPATLVQSWIGWQGGVRIGLWGAGQQF